MSPKLSSNLICKHHNPKYHELGDCGKQGRKNHLFVQPKAEQTKVMKQVLFPVWIQEKISSFILKIILKTISKIIA